MTETGRHFMLDKLDPMLFMLNYQDLSQRVAQSSAPRLKREPQSRRDLAQKIASGATNSGAPARHLQVYRVEPNDSSHGPRECDARTFFSFRHVPAELGSI
jgi:hypothetical protein